MALKMALKNVLMSVLMKVVSSPSVVVLEQGLSKDLDSEK
jgi:hypothetical protein